jgi:hypothetical protein
VDSVAIISVTIRLKKPEGQRAMSMTYIKVGR